ncbi:GNAT family N-acetyltransferase [Psychrosphaera haliotis]|nr:GNAT family N-acetyltransferase [Psychrosphaera haliotis]
MTDYLIKNLSNEDFAAVIELGNKVHGDGYLDETSISKILDQSTVGSLNASYVMYHDQTLVGFRLSYAPNKWPLDKWCTSDKWPVNKEHVAYFKCNTIHPDYQGKGLGGQLLQTSITTLKEMGAKAGLSHIWMQSPGNASFKYFTKAGGQLIKTHARRWNDDPTIPDYVCILCGNDCHCDASEMMLVF